MRKDLKEPDSCGTGAVTLRRISAIFLALSLLAVLLALFSACGKKGPPFLPEKKLAARVEGLTGKWVDGTIRLEGSIEGDDREKGITGCTVYHARYPLDQPPCEGCPIEMEVVTEGVQPTIAKDLFVCDVPVTETKGIWFLEVRLTGSDGAVGPPSARITLQVED
jgi:predicted small lipoprotein YifL